MSKSDLQARPIYHRKRDSIDAHLNIVFAALAVSRWIEARTGWSIRKFVKTARRYREIKIQAGQQTITAADPSLTTSATPSTPSTTPADLRTNLSQLRAEFLGHFERRKVATGTCGRAFGTPCSHEHSCLRCAMHWPDPAQRPRIAEIRDNLTARIAEAEREGWLGEAEGLKISLAGAEDKLAQIDRRTRPAAIDLGMPTPARQT